MSFWETKKINFFLLFNPKHNKAPFLKTKPFFQRFTPSQQSVSEWGESRSIFFLRRLQLLRSVAALLQQKLILHPRRVPNEKKTRMMLLCFSVCYVRCVCLFVTFVRPSVPFFKSYIDQVLLGSTCKCSLCTIWSQTGTGYTFKAFKKAICSSQQTDINWFIF